MEFQEKYGRLLVAIDLAFLFVMLCNRLCNSKNDISPERREVEGIGQKSN